MSNVTPLYQHANAFSHFARVIEPTSARIIARCLRPSEQSGGYEFMIVLTSAAHLVYSFAIDAPTDIDGDIPDVGDIILGVSTTPQRFFTSTGTFVARIASFERLVPRPISVVLSGPPSFPTRVVTRNTISPEHAVLTVLDEYPDHDLVDVFAGPPVDLRFPLDNILSPETAAFEPLHPVTIHGA